MKQRHPEQQFRCHTVPRPEAAVSDDENDAVQVDNADVIEHALDEHGPSGDESEGDSVFDLAEMFEALQNV